MEKISGLTLNLEKSSSGVYWYLYFDAGSFIGPGIRKDTGDYILKLSKQCSDSIISGHVYFNPVNNKWNIFEEFQDNYEGYHVGGYIITPECKLIFVGPSVPDCENVTEYRRDFDDSYDQNFDQLSINCDTPPEVLDDVCGQFLEENFSNDYDINCVVLEEKDQFNLVEFNKDFEVPTD
jgi:hypothetical protein